MRTVAAFGAPDLFVTEYFRVHIHSRPDPYLLRSITENETGKPILAQMIGRDTAELVRTAKTLQNFPVAGIDLNLGCPAPVVCRKDAGGGLLRDPEKVNELLDALRYACPEKKFTVKTRLGYDQPEEFLALLEIFQKHSIDALTIHGRTVKERYQTPIHPDYIRLAADSLSCPVVANGNVVNVQSGLTLLQLTGADGLMVGRGAIRHPWLFRQLASALEGQPTPIIPCREVWHYLQMLFDETARERTDFIEEKHVQKMKKYLVFIVQGHPPELEFRMRRVRTQADLFALFRDFLDHDDPVPDLPPETSRLFCGFSELLT